MAPHILKLDIKWVSYILERAPVPIEQDAVWAVVGLVGLEDLCHHLQSTLYSLGSNSRNAHAAS
jgi:hypothetical protein